MSLKEYRNHQLRAMVAYYGQHYQAFVHLRGPDGTYASGRWMLYDDARASEVGSWEDVQRKCYAGKIQVRLWFTVVFSWFCQQHNIKCATTGAPARLAAGRTCSASATPARSGCTIFP